MLEIKNLHVNFKGKEILKGLNLNLAPGKIHALMGPNGSGKTTLAHVLAGDPKYNVTKGKVLLNKKNILNLNPSDRAKMGLFLSFQNPVEIEGIKLSTFLRQAYNSVHKEKLSILEFNELLEKKADELKIPREFLSRYLNKGFSGGEKKKAEILQLLVLNPRVAILDEVDSGTDVDALKMVAKAINNINKSTGMTVLIITHYSRVLKYLKPDKVFLMIDGEIVKEDNSYLADEIDEKGYLSYKKFK